MLNPLLMGGFLQKLKLVAGDLLCVSDIDTALVNNVNMHLLSN